MTTKAKAADVMGGLIHAARIAKGWSPEDLADRVGKTVWTVYDWERGRSVPRLEEQPAVTAVLGLGLAELFPPPLGVLLGGCGVPGCPDHDCPIEYGRCHCGCGEQTARATWSTRSRGLVKGEPVRYVAGHFRNANDARWSKGYVYARDNAEPLRAARRARGWSQDELGRRAGLGGAVSTLGDLERIIARRIPERHAKRVASQLGRPFEELFAHTPPAEARASERVRTPQVERPGDRPKAAVVECAELCRKLDCWTGLEAAEWLGVDPKMLTHYERRGLIAAAQVFDGGPFKARLYPIKDVKRLGRDLWRTRRDDHRWHFDSERVKRWAIARGRTRTQAERLARRVRDRNERRAKARPDTGRPKSEGPPSYHVEWADAYDKLKRELCEQYEAFHVEGDPPPTRCEVALLVAEADFEEHPERWAYAPSDNSRAAADKVWKAVKALQSPQSETRSA